MNINNLPNDILLNIISELFLVNSPILTYTLKYLCKNFYTIINNNKFQLSYEKDDIILINKLYLNGNIDIFKWLCSNKYTIDYSDILLTIEYNRLDILNLLMNYKCYHKTIFNRFYLTDTNFVDNFTIFDLAVYSKSFITHSIDHNNIEIFKFFIENKEYKMYYNQIPKIFNIICLKGNEIFLKYLLNNYSNIIDKSIIEINIKKIINNINNLSINKKENILNLLKKYE